MPEFPSDPRRWQRHFRDMQGLGRIFPTGSAGPSSPRIFAPWLSDTVQLNFPVPPLFGVAIPADPAAGAEWTSTVPDTEDELLVSIHFEFVTDATVSNRVVNLEFLDTVGRVILTCQARRVIPAGTSAVISCSAIGEHNVDLVTGFNTILLPPRFRALANTLMRTRTQNIQVGDQFQNIRRYAERWPRFQ